MNTIERAASRLGASGKLPAEVRVMDLRATDAANGVGPDSYGYGRQEG